MLLSIKQILAIPDPRFPANPFYQLLSYQKDDKNPTNLVQWQDIDLTKSDGRSDFLINHLEDSESSGTTSDSSDDFVMISKNSLNGWLLKNSSSRNDLYLNIFLTNTENKNIPDYFDTLLFSPDSQCNRKFGTYVLSFSS